MGTQLATGEGAQRASPVKRIGAHALSLDERRELCLDLLDEFGADNVAVNEHSHEIVHSCCLPLGGHSHGDRRPSASLNYEKLTYICRTGCGSGGLLWFIAVCRGVDGPTARQWLEQSSGLTEDAVERLVDVLESIYAPGESIEVPMPSFSPAVLKPWAWVHPYLTELRGIPVANIEQCQVGYDPGDQRIVVPHFWEGDLVGWQKRRLVNDGTPKWQSSPDFPKARTLFRMPPRGERPVVVEAPLSVVAKCHLAPFTATFGAQVSDRQVRLLSRFDEVVLWFDNDPAGWDATRRVGEALVSSSVVWVVDSPYAADPADMDDDTTESLLASAVPYPLWQPPSTVAPWPPEGKPMRKYGTPEKIEAPTDEDPQGITAEKIAKVAKQHDEDREQDTED